MHLRHHTYLGDPRDPDDYANYTTRPRRLWLMHFLRLAFGAFLYLLFIPILSMKNGSPEQRRRIIVEYMILLVLAGITVRFVPGDVLLWAWGLPVILVGYMTNVRADLHSTESLKRQTLSLPAGPWSRIHSSRFVY